MIDGNANALLLQSLKKRANSCHSGWCERICWLTHICLCPPVRIAICRKRKPALESRSTSCWSQRVGASSMMHAAPPILRWNPTPSSHCSRWMRWVTTSRPQWFHRLSAARRQGVSAGGTGSQGRKQDPLIGKEQARKYAKAKNCRFVFCPTETCTNCGTWPGDKAFTFLLKNDYRSSIISSVPLNQFM